MSEDFQPFEVAEWSEGLMRGNAFLQDIEVVFYEMSNGTFWPHWRKIAPASSYKCPVHGRTMTLGEIEKAKKAKAPMRFWKCLYCKFAKPCKYGQGSARRKRLEKRA